MVNFGDKRRGAIRETDKSGARAAADMRSGAGEGQNCRKACDRTHSGSIPLPLPAEPR